MKNLWLFTLLFVLLTTPLSAQTQEFPWTSGNAFLRICSVIDNKNMTLEEGRQVVGCLGYVTGFTYGVVYENNFADYVTSGKAPAPFCIPEGVEMGQILQIGLKYIRDNSTVDHLPTATLIAGALGKAYPCPAK